MMRRKAVVVLWSTTLVFLLFMLLFLSQEVKPKNIGAETHIKLLEVAEEAEGAMFFVEHSAKLSFEKALLEKVNDVKFSFLCKEDVDSCRRDFFNSFEKHFTDYLEVFNEEFKQELKYEDFELSLNLLTSRLAKESKSLEIKGVSKKSVVFKEREIKYKIKPKFRAVV